MCINLFLVYSKEIGKLLKVGPSLSANLSDAQLRAASRKSQISSTALLHSGT